MNYKSVICTIIFSAMMLAPVAQLKAEDTEPRRQEFFMRTTMLAQMTSVEQQVKELERLFEDGLTPDMVLIEAPAIGDRPAVKITTTNFILGLNEALVQVLLDHGADVDQVVAEIDKRIAQANESIAKMNELKNMVQTYCPNN